MDGLFLLIDCYLCFFFIYLRPYYGLFIINHLICIKSLTTMKQFSTLLFFFLFTTSIFAQTSKDPTVSVIALANATTPSITLNWKSDNAANYFAIYEERIRKPLPGIGSPKLIKPLLLIPILPLLWERCMNIW